MTDVESRLRAASEALHHSAAVIPTGEPPSPRSRLPLLVAAAATAVVLVVGAALGFAQNDGEAGVDVSTDPPPNVSAPAVDEDYRSLLGWDYPGGRWEVYTESGRLCGMTTGRFVGSRVCDDDMESRAIVLNDNRGEPVVLFGVLPDAAVEVDAGIAPADDGLVGRVIVPEPNVEPRVYAIPIHGHPEPNQVTFLDDDGNVITTEPVA